MITNVTSSSHAALLGDPNQAKQAIDAAKALVNNLQNTINSLQITIRNLEMLSPDQATALETKLVEAKDAQVSAMNELAQAELSYGAGFYDNAYNEAQQASGNANTVSTMLTTENGDLAAIQNAWPNNSPDANLATAKSIAADAEDYFSRIETMIKNNPTINFGIDLNGLATTKNYLENALANAQTAYNNHNYGDLVTQLTAILGDASYIRQDLDIAASHLPPV
ncbi:MAG: hypothetical protein JSS32_07915 [Verrucomicrobia bacterium]|nr:hypothetical protein [Verrucomicrobiota bacterium]